MATAATDTNAAAEAIRSMMNPPPTVVRNSRRRTLPQKLEWEEVLIGGALG
jgi:hypothetical protein